MKKVKVFLVGPSLKTQGGISSVNSIYLKELRNDINIRLISSYYGRNRIIDCIYFFYALILVNFYCLTNKNAIFHINSASKGSYLRKSILANICLGFKKKVIFHIHGASFDQFIESSKEVNKRGIINMLNRVDKVVVLSEAWKDYFCKYIKAEHIEVLSNPCPVISEKYKERNNEKLTILFVGRMGQRKGTYDLIEAIKRLESKQIYLQLFGDGESKKVQEIVNKEGLTESIRVNGWVSHKHLISLYDNADLLVLPSYAEGLPMAILEAMGRGLPIISTNVGGIPEAVIDGYNGYIIKPGNVDELKDRIEMFIDNSDLVKSMGLKSLDIAKEKFSIDVIRNKLLSIYKGLYIL